MPLAPMDGTVAAVRRLASKLTPVLALPLARREGESHSPRHRRARRASGPRC